MNTTQLAAWSVHLYTALGAVLGFLALEAIARDQYALAFLWMAVATIIDSTDGSLARRFRVKQVLPTFDGARLDDIVDYLNYVVVPIVLAYDAGLVPATMWGRLVCAAPLLASGYGFCQVDAKTADHFFKGFPSYWNIVVFYLYVLGTPTWFNTFTLLVFSVLVFVPIRYLYPSRNPVARRVTILLGLVWGVCLFTLLAQFPYPSKVLGWLSLFYPLYYLGLSIHLDWRLRKAANPSSTQGAA
ncbi:MAG: CDP-alcohol phosphatidyltransferase family protein [Candidatus Binatia bacterium]|nr:CDP-alcohol phosphatidyltransferase family protein [Candidatus Binatia bacterium]